MSEHTPIPWRLVLDDYIRICGSTGKHGWPDQIGYTIKESDAKLIVEAVNNYERLRTDNAMLVEALEEMRTPPFVMMSDNACDVAGWFIQKIEATLAKVKK